jgi:hypothetical protein
MPNLNARYMITVKTVGQFWDEEIRAFLNDSPNFIRTDDKASGSKGGGKMAAMAKRHLIDRSLLPETNRLTIAYNGLKKPTLLLNFVPYEFKPRVIRYPQRGGGWHEMYSPRFGWRVVVAGVIIHLYETYSGSYLAQAFYSHHKIGSAHGLTRHAALHALFSKPIWYFHNASIQWVGLDWLYKSIHIRFPLSKIPYPKQYITDLNLKHVQGLGHLRWDQLKRH